MNHYILFSLLVLSTILSPGISRKLSIVWDERLNSYGLVKGEAENFISLAEYYNEVNETGWATLEIHTNANHTDIDQAYTAGLVEALITSDLIKLAWRNSFEGYCGKPLSAYCQKLKNYVDTNAVWMQQQIDSFADTDPYWHQVRLFLIQMQGLIDGYGFHQSKRHTLDKFIYKPDITGLLLIQLSGDLEELQTIFNGERKLRHIGTGHCSALIKLLPGNSDLYTSQVTWNTFGSMLRILKRYHFGYHLLPGSSSLVPGNDITFSSYPGLLLSGDDFYVLSSGLVTLETTIGNSNDSLWQYIKPTGSVFESIRNVVANRLATTGAEWTQLFSKFNSGTYNNQWMIVNYNQFVPGGADLQDGLLWVLEQLPGMVMSRDVTYVLRNLSYWPSYNIPFFPEIFDASGWPPLVAKYGNWFSYDWSPRANIFRRDHRKVLNTDSMIKLMRYNDYTHDPFSACNCTPPYSAENAISARCDLNPANGTYPFDALGHRSHGATDMKLTTSEMMKNLQFVAISGPTHDPLPPFQWSKSDFDKTVAHFGHPDLWMFKPVLHKWSGK